MSSTRRISIHRLQSGSLQPVTDEVAVEEPLEIRVGRHGESGRDATPISITMRTPGCDGDLAVGFLFSEGILRSPLDLGDVRRCGPPGSNTVLVELAPGCDLDLARLERHFYTSSSCGVCGKTSLEAVAATHVPTLGAGPQVAAARLGELPDALREAQDAFERTGGIHAAGLFSPDGTLQAVREDVGRHNALDKLVGHYVRQGVSDLAGSVLVLSGRASFELIQKALMARISVVVAVGAPSSLAVDLAALHDMSLTGFTRKHSFNVYCGDSRILG